MKVSNKVQVSKKKCSKSILRQFASVEELANWINKSKVEDPEKSPETNVINALIWSANFHKKEIEFFRLELSKKGIAEALKCLVARGSYEKEEVIYLCLIFKEADQTYVFWNELKQTGRLRKRSKAVKDSIKEDSVDIRLSKGYRGNEGDYLKLRHALATEVARGISRRVIILGESRRILKGPIADGLRRVFCEDRSASLFCLHVTEPTKLDLSKMCRPQDLIILLTVLDGRILLRDSANRFYWIVEQIRNVKRSGSKSVLLFAGDSLSSRRKKEGCEGVSYFASENITSRLESQEVYLATAFKNVLSLANEVDDEISLSLKAVFDQGNVPDSLLIEDWTFMLGSGSSIWDSCNIVRVLIPK